MASARGHTGAIAVLLEAKADVAMIAKVQEISSVAVLARD